MRPLSIPTGHRYGRSVMNWSNWSRSTTAQRLTCPAAPSEAGDICSLRRHRHSRPLLRHVFQLTAFPVPLFGQTWAARPDASVMAGAARVSGRLRVIVLLRGTACGGLGSGGEWEREWEGEEGVGQGGKKGASLPTWPNSSDPRRRLCAPAAKGVRFPGAVLVDAKREIFYCSFAAKTWPEVQGLPKFSDFLFSEGRVSSVKVPVFCPYVVSYTCRFEK